jgi:hypothetical protein
MLLVPIFGPLYHLGGKPCGELDHSLLVCFSMTLIAAMEMTAPRTECKEVCQCCIWDVKTIVLNYNNTVALVCAHHTG